MAISDDPTAPPVPGAPWHPGERAMQQRAGVTAIADQRARFIRGELIDQHQAFYPQLPFVVLGSVDGDGAPWATLRAGRPGFLHAGDPHRLHLALARDAADPADAGLRDGASVGLLGIELHTRRRNRLNGRVRGLAADGFDVEVEQAYGNCPKYIQQRDFAFSRDPAEHSPVAPRRLPGLDARARQMLRADTFFVATYVDLGEDRRQVDVSHRGGRPGFVHVDAEGTLTIPDFVGNQLFNTLGNLLQNPRAGLAFVDFERGDLLQLSGRAEVGVEHPLAEFEGALRLWRMWPHEIVYREAALPLRWSLREGGWSPSTLGTGRWAADPAAAEPPGGR